MKRMPFIVSCLLASASGLAIADISTERKTELIYLLKQDCGSCHGMTLKGGLGPALLPETLIGTPKELLVTTILEGRAGTAMPPWKTMLTQDEAEWITVQLLQGVK
jgi:cytochrome c55X